MGRRRLLLTGGTGLIGRAVIERLAGDDELISLGRTEPPPGAKWLKADLNAPLNLALLPDSVDAVVCLAQSEHFRDFPQRSQEIFQVNVASVATALDWARQAGARRFVLASSGGVYGHGENAFREDDVIGPSGPLGYYLASKQCAELLTESYASLFNVVILRFFFVYGPGQKRSMLIPRLIDSVRKGHPVTLQGPDGIRLNPTYVSDAAEAVCHSLELDSSHIINVAGNDVLSLRELALAIGGGVGREPIFDIRREEVPRHLVADTERMGRLLGPPRVTLQQGLAAMLRDSDASSLLPGAE